MKSVVEYVWLDNDGNFRSKSRTLQDVPAMISDLPKWNYDGSSTGQAEGKDSEVILIPIYLVSCPFRGGKGHHYVTLCHTVDRNECPLPNNHYPWAKQIFDNDKVKDAHPWYGLEQEYFITDSHDVPLGLEDATKQGQFYCGVGTGNAYGRIISDQHYQCCLGADLEISGVNAEVAPGQWEFQIGPVEGIDAACQLLLARYFLVRLTELHGLKVTFHPKPKILIQDQEKRATTWNGSGCHTNFSTEKMRAEGGSKEIEAAIASLKEKHELHMKHYGADNDLRMTGECETARFDTFTVGRANRGASIRIPNEVIKNKCGYFEDRRPASNCDPYLVTGLIAATVLGVEHGITG